MGRAEIDVHYGIIPLSQGIQISYCASVDQAVSILYFIAVKCLINVKLLRNHEHGNTFRNASTTIIAGRFSYAVIVLVKAHFLTHIARLH